MKYSLLTGASVLIFISSFVRLAESSIIEPQNVPTTETRNTAAAIYLRRCALCHGRDGRANTTKGRLRSARNLTDSQWQAEVRDERIFNSITNGRGKMPAYGKKVSEAVIESLVSYVRGLKQ